jgi:hypothetical protein
MTMKPTKTLQVGFAIIATFASLNFAVVAANGQTRKSDQKIASVNSGGRDPFAKYKPPAAVVKRAGAPTLVPSIQQRIEDYRAQKVAAMNAHVTAPKAVTAFLLSEIQVVGISRSPRGYAAIVEATPIKLAYVIYPGERFYDGQLVAIEDNRLVFRREIVYSDGKRERAVETKPLRQANAVDSMSAVSPKTVAPAPRESVSEKKSEKPASEKP